MNAEPADAQGYVNLTCRSCGFAFCVFHPAEADIHEPACDSCKRKEESDSRPTVPFVYPETEE